MIKGLNLYTQEEVNEMISTIDTLMAEIETEFCNDSISVEFCKNTRSKLKDLKYFIEHGSSSTNYATKNQLHYTI